MNAWRELVRRKGLELQHYPKKFLVYNPGVVRKPYSLIRNRFRGRGEFVQLNLLPCVKNTEEEHQPKSRVNPRGDEELIDVQRLNDGPFADVVAKRLKTRKGHPDKKDPHTKGIFLGHRGTCGPNNETDQCRNRPLTKGTTWEQHNCLEGLENLRDRE